MKRLHNMDFKSRIIKVDLRHSELHDRRWPEIRIDNGITVWALKDKLYLNCGTPPGDMALYAYDPSDMMQSQVFMDNDERELHTYGIEDGHVIYICVLQQLPQTSDVAVRTRYARLMANLDNSPLKTNNSRLHQHYMEQLERCCAENDESVFQQYRMSDEDYEERGRGLREFIVQMRMKAGIIPAKRDPKEDEKAIEELKEKYPLESRCLVTPGDIRGTVRFVGMVKNKICIGVDLDEPFGHCDGSLDNEEYFIAKGTRYGGFYSSDQVQVGDYPELDPFDDA